ncbi:MAG: hypothetical protein R6X19_09780 [Kiritimatiellia bacterium]
MLALAGQPLLAQPAAAEREAAEPESERTISFEGGVPSPTAHGPLLIKPDRFNSFSERLDFIHANMEPTLKRHVIRADDLFRNNTLFPSRQPETRFRLVTQAELRAKRNDWSYRFEPNFDADIDLPALEHRWRLYLHSRARDTIGERDPDEGERTTRLGLYRFRKEYNISTDTGVRLRTIPEAYARIQWGHNWNPGLWVIRPGQRFFYETDKGYGSLTSLTFHRWVSTKPHVFIQAISSAENSETSQGTEFEQVFRVGKVREALEFMDRWERVLGDRDIARGYVFRFSVTGRDEHESVVDGYRLGAVIRRPLYKKWIYLHINPEVMCENDSNWEPELRIRVSFDMLFWGAQER